MQIYTCASGNTNQQFQLTSAKQIVWKNHNECLDLTDSNLTDGAQVRLPSSLTLLDFLSKSIDANVGLRK